VKIARIDRHTEPPRIAVRPFADERQLREVIVLKLPMPQSEGAMELMPTNFPCHPTMTTRAASKQ
jgi:hypothetical protein